MRRACKKNFAKKIGQTDRNFLRKIYVHIMYLSVKATLAWMT